MPIALVKPTGPGDDFCLWPTRGIAMVRRRNAEDINAATIQDYRAMAIAAKMDRSAGEAAFEARQLKFSLNVRRSCGTDPGPAGFDWVEIDF
jgi:hypothetical protein